MHVSIPRKFATIFLAALATLAVLTAAQAGTTGKLGNAPIVIDNPKGLLYTAHFTGAIAGWVNATSAVKGVGVNFFLEVWGLPRDTNGTFKYHIHVNPVPSDGNCTSTGGHLDPYERLDSPACDAMHPETCEIGDLSGKYGALPGGLGLAVKVFNDPYASLTRDKPAFIGNRSVVFHDSTGARIACASFSILYRPSRYGQGK